MKKRKRTADDLNARITESGRTNAHRFSGVDGEVWFEDIEEKIVRRLRDPAVSYVLVASPWMSSQTVLRELAKKKGCAILTNRERGMRSSKVRNGAFGKLSAYGTRDRVRVLSVGSGKTKSIPHQKFIVLLDEAGQPLGCIFGSYNLSGGAPTNLEVMSYCAGPEMAHIFQREWERVYKVCSKYLT
jgi:hypothetical protein